MYILLGTKLRSLQSYPALCMVLACYMFMASGCQKNQSSNQEKDAQAAANHHIELVFSTNNHIKNTTDTDIAAQLQLQKNTLIVYMPKNALQLQKVITAFTQEKNIDVSVFAVGNSSHELMQRLKEEGKNSPADMVILTSALALETARNNDFFQSVTSENLHTSLPKILRSENSWFGLASHSHVLVSQAKQKIRVNSYKDLASPRFKGQLCMKTSKSYATQALLASFVEHYGMKKSSAIVKGWQKNLAQKPATNDVELLDAVSRGTCTVALVNERNYVSYISNTSDTSKLVKTSLNTISNNQVGLTGVGVTKYAPNALKALALVEWLTKKDSQIILNADSHTQAVTYELLSPTTIQVLKDKANAEIYVEQSDSDKKSKIKKPLKQSDITTSAEKSEAPTEDALVTKSPLDITQQLLQKYKVRSKEDLSGEDAQAFHKEKRMLDSLQVLQQQPVKDTVIHLAFTKNHYVELANKIFKDISFS